jgi:hypothetical protein
LSWLDYLDLDAATDLSSLDSGDDDYYRIITGDRGFRMAAENPGGTKSSSAGGAGVNGTGTGDANTASSSAAGIPFYEKQRQHLKELIAKKRALEKKLVRFHLY